MFLTVISDPDFIFIFISIFTDNNQLPWLIRLNLRLNLRLRLRLRIPTRIPSKD
jgi:hypothetical protein